MVSEAGASVYSASELARQGVPRPRRDACAAPSRSRAACRTRWPSWSRSSRRPSASASTSTTSTRRGSRRSLDAVVEDCVNAVGVDVNTASAPLLARVSGLNPTLAAEHRRATATSNGAFKTRTALLKVPRLGAEDLRAGGGLPAHHERRRTRSTPRRCTRKPIRWSRRSPTATQAAAEVDHRRRARSCKSLKPGAVRRRARSASRPSRDILAELEKPGRDPRPEFKTATFQDGVEKISRPEARHAARRRRHQRRGVRRLRRHRRAPGRPGARLPAGRPLRQGPARGGEGRRRRQGARARRSTWRASASR